MTRKIIHIDMDAFYASIEQRDNPDLKGKPVAVGQADGRGVVAAASYEARRYGVRSAMSSSKARRLCPSLIFVDCRFDVYKAVSAQIHEIFHRFTDIIEPISLDEAFLDVTHNFPGIELAVDIARQIKQLIHTELGLIASAGVSYNKFLAKIASDYRKPDGLCVIAPPHAEDFIARMPVETFWGVGPVTASKMHALGIYTGSDLRRLSLPELRLHFGKAGRQYYDFARGIDLRPVEPYRIRKSVGCEETFETDISAPEEQVSKLEAVIRELSRRLTRANFEGYTLTLKVRFADFTNLSRSMSGVETDNSVEELRPFAMQLLEKADIANRPIRLLGLSMASPNKDDDSKGDSRQLHLDFDE